MEKVFLIILKNYDKNTVALKNIKEFIKNFLEKVVKISKIKENTKHFIRHFCGFFLGNTKSLK